MRFFYPGLQNLSNNYLTTKFWINAYRHRRIGIGSIMHYRRLLCKYKSLRPKKLMCPYLLECNQRSLIESAKSYYKRRLLFLNNKKRSNSFIYLYLMLCILTFAVSFFCNIIDRVSMWTYILYHYIKKNIRCKSSMRKIFVTTHIVTVCARNPSNPNYSFLIKHFNFLAYMN